MNEHTIAGMDAGLDAFAVPPRSGTVGHPTRRELRLGVAALDFAQTVLVGVAAHAAASGAEVASWKALCLGLLVAGLAGAARCAMHGADAPAAKPVRSASARAALATSASIGAAGAICWLLAPHVASEVLARWFAAWAGISGAGSAVLRFAAARFGRAVCGPIRAVVVGPPAREAPDRDALGRDAPGRDAPGHDAPAAWPAAPAPEDGWRSVGYIAAGEAGWLDRLRAAVVRDGVEVVVLVLRGPDADGRVADVCARLADQPVRVCLAVATGALGRTPRDLERFGGAALVDLLGDPQGGLDGAAKRAMDIALSALALAALSPVLAAAAVAVRAESPGPVIFRQKRFGLAGRPIEVLKFRSMRVETCDATGARRTLARDPRVTRVGRVLRRLSIDELPQLINVLRGDMSLVGPRPHPLHMRVGELYYFDAVERYRTRHLVKPGITGWAQVNGSRGEVDTIEKARRRVELDLWYLENWSVWLDVRVIARTILGGFLTRTAD